MTESTPAPSRSVSHVKPGTIQCGICGMTFLVRQKYSQTLTEQTRCAHCERRFWHDQPGNGSGTLIRCGIDPAWLDEWGYELLEDGALAVKWRYT